MKTVLYYSPGACSLAPHILLEEAGIDYELVEVNVQKGKTRDKSFLELNPKGRVPVLRSGEDIITEVPAICWYIGHSSREAQKLIPRGLIDQARVLEWFNWLSGTLHSIGFSGKWRPQRFTANPASYGEIKARADATLQDGFAHIEQQLNGRAWALGDAYSIVDPYLFVFHRWAGLAGADVPGAYPRWHAHAVRMSERPAVVRALQQEGI
jgi:glutathione S-transferase